MKASVHPLPTPPRARAISALAAEAALRRPPAPQPPAGFPAPLRRPATEGDQVLFYFDARPGFTTFLTLRNAGPSDQTVRILFYGPDVGTPLVHTVVIPIGPARAGPIGLGGLVVIDVRALVDGGLPPTAGIAMATAIDDAGRSIVTRVLSGTCTVANLATSAAWGSQGLARSAVQKVPGDPEQAWPAFTDRPRRGTIIDGTSVALQPIQPTRAVLATFFDPTWPTPVTAGGGQLVFIAFADEESPVYGAHAATTTFQISGVPETGVLLEPASVTVSGVALTDLASVAGGVVDAGSCSLSFASEPGGPRVTRAILYTKALGMFGTGSLLPR